MFGLNKEMIKGLLERYGYIIGPAILPFFLPADWATVSCFTAGGVEVTYGQMGLIAGLAVAATYLGVKLNTSSSLAHASKVAARAATSTTKEDIKVAEETVKELKGTAVE